MKEYLIEVINYVPSFYPFETKDRAIGLANFYAQSPTQNYRKLHDDIVYRRFIQTCDVVGVPIGPCNKLLRGNLIPCVRGGGGGGGPVPFPVCVDDGVDLPCKCQCPGACLTAPGVGSDYIENWDRNQLLEFIDGANNFPDSVPGSSNITHELAGNGLWIGLNPTCRGVWIGFSDCETGSFSGFYQLESPESTGEIRFGLDDSVILRGRGQRIKIQIDDPESSEPRYERYQVYYAYEFAYQLGLQPPNDMTFKLAGDNLIKLAENDFVGTQEDGGIAEEGGNFEVSSDPYSRFCSSIFYPVQTRGCIRTTENQGGPGEPPCVCEEPYLQEVPPISEEIPTSLRKYIRKNDVPDQYKSAGLFSYDDGTSTACENIVFERDNADNDDEGGLAEIPISEEDKYYDAFSRSVITWSEDANWENEGDGFNTWFSWKTVNQPVIIWNENYAHDNCYNCLLNKKKNGINDPGIPPCENIPCKRIEINANPDPDLFENWAALDNTSDYSQGGLAGEGSSGITKSQAAEWDFFTKFGFPTLEKYSFDLNTEETNKLWYDEMKSRFIEITDDTDLEGGLAAEVRRFVREANQYTIPCFPRKPCNNEETRITQIFDVVSPCDETFDAVNFGKHEIFMGSDLSVNGCAGCPKCYPPGCCVSIYDRYTSDSSPLPLAHYYSLSLFDAEYQEQNELRYKLYSDNFNKDTTSPLECYTEKCSKEALEAAFQVCIADNENDFELQNKCIEQVAEACFQEIDTYIASDWIFSCFNYLGSTVITRTLGEGNIPIWTWDGKVLPGCGIGGVPSAIQQCVYELQPTRPSSAGWLEINYGQCYRYDNGPTNEETQCFESTPVWTDPRKYPLIVAGLGPYCPGDFDCNICKIDSYSQCSCCSANLFLDNKTDRGSRSLSYNCSSEICPQCCSMCSDNEEGIHSCDDVNINSNAECYIDDCLVKYYDVQDCLTLNQNYKLNKTICVGDDNCAELPDCNDSGSGGNGGGGIGL